MTLDQHQQMLIDMGHLWAETHDGQPPRVRDWKKVTGSEWPSYQTAVRAFGTWDRFIEACGWPPRGRGRPKKGQE